MLTLIEREQQKTFLRLTLFWYVVVPVLASERPDHHNYEKRENSIPSFEALFMVCEKREGRRGKTRRIDHHRMVPCQAPKAMQGGNRLHKQQPAEILPILRMRTHIQERLHKRWHTEVCLQWLQKEVQPADWNDIRFQKDSHFGMGRIPAAPIRVP